MELLFEYSTYIYALVYSYLSIYLDYFVYWVLRYVPDYMVYSFDIYDRKPFILTIALDHKAESVVNKLKMYMNIYWDSNDTIVQNSGGINIEKFCNYVDTKTILVYYIFKEDIQKITDVNEFYFNSWWDIFSYEEYCVSPLVKKISINCSKKIYTIMQYEEKNAWNTRDKFPVYNPIIFGEIDFNK